VATGLRAALLACSLLAGIGAAAATPDAESIAIGLTARVQQDDATLALGDIAAIDTAGATHQSLRKLALPAKGKVGDTVVYARAEIAALVDKAFPGLAQRLRWSGPERVLVERRGVVVAPDEYIEWAARELRAHWATLDGRIELQAVNDYRPLTLPRGVRSVEARFTGDEVRRTSKVWLDIAIDGKPYTTATVVFDVRWWRPALVLKQRGNARQRMQPELTTVAEVDISLANGVALQDAQQLQGKRLRRDTEAGRPLSADDLEDIPAVELGATVRVETQVGRVAIQTLAVAERDGAIGQRIAVRHPKNNEQLMVEVIGENRAIVSDRQAR
jgi:flagella basal body P-ring formation protein FlgA